jgi:hypothetical protein
MVGAAFSTGRAFVIIRKAQARADISPMNDSNL